MPVLETLRGVRVVADSQALDAARWTGSDVLVLRSAPDEAFAIGATDVELDDPHAIITPESGFVGGWLELGSLLAHIEWALPASRPTLLQGSIAGVPAKVWLPSADGRALLVVAAAVANELDQRLR